MALFRLHFPYTFPQQQADRDHLVFCFHFLFDALQQQTHAPLCQLLHRLGNGRQTGQGIFTDLQTVTDELTQVDLAGMVSNVDSLVTSSQEAVTQATEKLEAIDIDALNSAIADLSSVVGPLADLVENLSFF